MGHFAADVPVQGWDTRLDTDVLIIGAGIAGLSLALRLPPHRDVLVVTKGALGESNTWYAQGGLAAAVGPDDDPALHFADTIAAGAGLCDADAVRALVDGGPGAVQWLLDAGTRFDRDDGALALGREAAHSRHRVLHAGGDATGAEIERSLVAELRARPSVRIIEHATALDLAHTQDGACAGALIHRADEGHGSVILIAAAATVLANGGAGQLWAVTSNPPGATGDGIAMALRAGAVVADLEFAQFHPTVLSLPGEVPFLITEAIRGEGAWLRTVEGERFMTAVHPLAELAPRDVVARAIQQQVTAHHGQPVYLDLRHLDAAMVRQRFPTITNRLRRHGLDLARDLIPVAPAAHYFMGGVVASMDGQTSLPGLYAIGEVSCTGVHGANRLASNSLLEGLVCGLRLGASLAAELPPNPGSRIGIGQDGTNRMPAGAVAETPARTAIQQVMSTHVAVVRDERGLATALERMPDLTADSLIGEPAAVAETSNLALLALEVTRSALARKESRGAHYRADHPEADPACEGQHQLLQRIHGNSRRWFGSLASVLPASPAAGDPIPAHPGTAT